MDYEEEFDLLAGACMLDVDLPTFLDDYRLPTDRQFDVVGSAVSLNNFTDFGSYAVNEFDGENCVPSKSFNGLEQFSLPRTPNSNNFTSNQRQNESPPSFLAPWHENFVDVEDEFAIFTVNVPNAEENTFLQNVIQQAETDRSVDDFLSIVENSSSPDDPLQNPQQILEEIYRECQQIDAASPRLVSETEFVDGGVVEVLEYFSPTSESSMESEDDTGSRSSNYTPGSCTVSEATIQDSDHSFARDSDRKTKKSSKNSSMNFGNGSIKKKSQNRVAASRYRSKKKLEKSFVETEVSLLETKNVQLKTIVDDLEREISYLKNFMREIRSAGGTKKKNITK